MKPVSTPWSGGIRPRRRGRGASDKGTCAALLCAALFAGAVPALAQDGPGTSIPRVAVASDTAFSYALYLPPGHDPGRRWPALVLMDPRGRALVALERFRDGAAEHGFVLISSYDTSSDEPTSAVATQTAVEVLLNETIDRLGLDPHRLYLAGFSGTARVGWTLAARNPDVIAGVAVFGAGTATAATLLRRAYGHPASVSAYFGGAGLEDFNFAEVWATDRRLAGEGQFAAVRFYAGGHAWPPAGVAREALEWFELHGQRTGRAPRDSAWLVGRYGVWLDRAAGLEADGRRYEAWRAYARTARAFDGLLDTSRAEVAVERLEDDGAVVRDRRSLERWLAWEAEARDRIADGIALLDAPELPSLEALVSTVGLPEIRDVSASEDTSAVHAAARVRAHLLVLAGFYRFRAFLDSGRPDNALRALELAQRADPGWATLCLRFSRLPVSERQKSSPLQDACPGAQGAAGWR